MEAYELSDDSYGTTEDKTLVKYKEKLEEVREMLVKMGRDSLESLVVIDSIQRLGLSYLLKDEIEGILHHHYLAPSDYHHHHHHLYKASLRFRLLRQQGYHVHADEYLMGFDVNFKSELDGVNSDMKGVLALYEASHLSMAGEDILREAAVFSSQYLNAWVEDDEQNADALMVVKNCLQNPQHKTLARFTPPEKLLHFLNVGNTWQNLLQELAFFESALLQPTHNHEFLQVVKWWKHLGLCNEMKSSRDQPQKWHMWSMGVLRGPTWSRHRILLTKPISLVYAVDDIFDLHGTIDQLTLFTQAVDRWDICEAEKLPNYMRICFIAIQDTTDEISRMVCQDYGWDPAVFLKGEWGNLFKAFLKEAKWLTSKELPNSEEYLENGVVSTGVPMVLSHLYVIMGNSFTQQHLLNHPRGLTYSVAKILRLLDDLGTAKDEEQEGHDGSYVEYYMKEEKVDSLEAAREHVMGLVSDTWENLNKQALSSKAPFSASFKQACLDAARMVPAMYNYDNKHRLPLLEQHVNSMFQDTTFTKSILG